MNARLFSALLALLLIYKITNAEVIPHNSIIYGNWTIENSPYIVMGIAIVPKDSTLIIDPGVTVLFKSSTEETDFNYETIDVGLIKVYGKILAVGTVTDSIFFSRNQEGYWGSISILNSSEHLSKFEYCHFEYGSNITDLPGGGNHFSGALGVSNSNTRIYRACFMNNKLSVISDKSNIEISESVIKDNIHGIILISSNSLITRNRINNNQANGVKSHSSCSVILNNLITNNKERGIDSYESNDSIAFNLIIDNGYSGISITRSNTISYRNIIWGSNSGIRVSGKPRIINNTILFNNYYGIYCDWQAQPIVVNSIIYNNPGFAYYHTQDTILFANSLLQTDSLPSNFLNGGGNIFNSNPNFVDEQNHDFALCENSPCIDSGVAFFIWEGETIVKLSSEEYNGNAPDIGAIESEYIGTFVENNWLNSFRLNQNYPNPFNESTNIELNLTDCEEAYLVIYNLSGSVVRYIKIIGLGPQVISWDGNDNNGNRLNSGIYICRLYTKQGIYSNTMLMSR